MNLRYDVEMMFEKWKDYLMNLTYVVEIMFENDEIMLWMWDMILKWCLRNDEIMLWMWDMILKWCWRNVLKNIGLCWVFMIYGKECGKNMILFENENLHVW
jgi:hypothetical protein